MATRGIAPQWLVKKHLNSTTSSQCGTRQKSGRLTEKTDMKVVMFISNAFTGDPRVYAEARTLIQAGYKVTVVAWGREKQNLPRQNWDGIDVVRLRTKLLPKQHRVGSLPWVALNLVLWQRQAYRQALALSKGSHFDVIHCHDLDTLAIGVRLKRKLGLPLIYDA
jgi:hypothetical protein